MTKNIVLYGLGEEVMTNVRRRVVIIDNALPRAFKFGHSKRRRESRSHKRKSERKKETEAKTM